jgi:PDZ domain-containing protein
VSRRTLTLLLSGVLAVVLTAAASAAQVPYVAYQPGPTFDTLGAVGGTPVIQVEGREVFPTEGRLDLTTISLRSELTLTEAVEGWLRRDRAVVPRELVFPPGESDEEVRQRNTERLIESETSATTAALRELGVPFTVNVEVLDVQAGLPADGVLRAGDVLASVDGVPVTSSEDLRSRITSQEPGTTLRIGYVRDGAPAQARLTTTAASSGEARSVIGVQLAEVPEYPFEVTITLDDVGGPSAGLMFALGILDKLRPESLTGGLYIAGTGEISTDGTVGPIGGVSQKIAAAHAKGADAFLVPDGNCEEAAASAPDGIQLVRVATLDDALAGLEALREGGAPPPGCDT